MGKNIILVDTNSFMHRAYHAYDEHLGTDNKCYRVLLGVLHALHKIHNKTEYSMFINVFDSEEGSLSRKALYPEYKKNRVEKEADLLRQIDVVEKAFGYMGIPYIKKYGEEADDVMGTIAKKEALKGNNILIVSGDKDISQLVQENIYLYRPIKDVSGKMDFDLVGEKGIKEKFGVFPNQIVDYLALIGDNADNIPGVDGIGPKKAAQLLETYHNIDNIYENINEIKGKMKESLLAGRDLLKISQELTKIKTDISITKSDIVHGEFTEKKIFKIQQRCNLFDWMGYLDQQKQTIDINYENNKFNI